MMSNLGIVILAFFAGSILGFFFFGGLWWTVQKGTTTKYPALLFLGSILVRTAVVLAGFFWIAGDHFGRLLACLLGFIVTRFLMLRYLRPPVEADSSSKVV